MGAHPTLIQSVQRALRLIEVIAEHDGRPRAKEIARAAGLPLPTTYHLLRTCAHEGWLQRLDDGSYVLGHRIDVVREHGTAARGVAHARPALEWLRDELGGSVYLARYVDGEIVVAEIVDSARAPRIDLWVGIHDAAHATALGKCILGQLPHADTQDYLARYVDGEVVVADIVDSARAPRIELWVGLHDAAHATAIGKSILGQLTAAERADYLGRHPLHDLTPRTVVDRRRLPVPSPGEVAVDDGEYAVGVRCVAAAVTGGVGSVGVVSMPTERAARAVLAAAARVSRALALGSGAA